MGIMKLDFDRITKRVSNFLLSMEKPFEVRVGFHGFNFRKDCGPGCNMGDNCYDCWAVIGMDDRNRLKINREQKINNLPHNVLWDIKRGKVKGEWTTIETAQQADRFLRQFTGYY